MWQLTKDDSKAKCRYVKNDDYDDYSNNNNKINSTIMKRIPQDDNENGLL